MVECVRFTPPRIGVANEIVFTSGVGYGELLSELAAREEFDAQNITMLDEEFGYDNGLNFGEFLDSPVNDD